MSETNTARRVGTGSDHGVNSDMQRLGQYVGQLHDDLAGIAKEAGEVAQAGVAAAKEIGESAIEAARSKTDLATASLRGRIRRHPGAAVGIAIGVGILIGLVGPAVARSKR